MIYLSKTDRPTTEKYITWAQQGLPGSKILSYDQVIQQRDADKVVLMGILRGTNMVYHWAQKNKIDFYFMDRPYWGESRSNPYLMRITKNGHVKNYLESRPNDRFKKYFPFKIEPWKKDGSKIVVCPPTHSMAVMFDQEDWLSKTLETLRANTDREIVVRNKGYNPDSKIDELGRLMPGANDNEDTATPIDWNNTHAIVTFNSNITIEATARGIPVYTDVMNSCAPIAETDFSKIETPKYADREPCYYSLAYGQFSKQEMKNGWAWRILDES